LEQNMNLPSKERLSLRRLSDRRFARVSRHAPHPPSPASVFPARDAGPARAPAAAPPALPLPDPSAADDRRAPPLPGGAPLRDAPGRLRRHPASSDPAAGAEAAALLSRPSAAAGPKALRPDGRARREGCPMPSALSAAG